MAGLLAEAAVDAFHHVDVIAGGPPRAASYAVASGKRIALLSVLDCSKKERAPFPVEDGIGILMDQQGSSTTFVITVLLQGNLVRPSDLSRKAS